jgi:hypothetical protein
VPGFKDNICKIEFDEIVAGYSLIDKLSTFLGVTEFNKDKMISIIDEYRKKQ